MCQEVEAQQMPLFSQYIENGFLLNPAMAGSRQYSPIRLSIRQQWVGVDGAPETQALSYNTNLGKACTTCPVYGNPFASRNNKMGVGLGGYVFNDSYGVVSRTGMEFSYAYHLRLSGRKYGSSGTKLSFGLGGLFYQYKFDGSAVPADDPLYTGTDEVSYVPDANFGVYLYNDDYFVGISMAHLFQSSVRLGDDNFQDDLMKRHLYAMAGYTFHVSETVDFEPAVIVRKTFDSDLYYDISSKLFIQNFWLAASYRTNNQIVGMIGLNYDRYYFGYSYDYYSDNLVASSSNGTHEITLGINLDVPVSVIRRNQSKIRRASYKAYSRSQRKSYRKRHKKFLFF
jgi:type IX secretion system PorP/SprF family membrane protein